MKKTLILLISIIGLSFAFIVIRNMTSQRENSASNAEVTSYQVSDNKTVYVYGKESLLEGNKKLPLVLFLNGTGGNPRQQALESGWVAKACEENIILIVPEYNDYATYSEVDYLVSVIEQAEQLFPVDTSRIYSLGFSNGGAISVALAARYPELLAGIAAYGWQVSLEEPKTGYQIPFQVIQGTNEATEYDNVGNPMVRSDTADSIRSLLLYNNMITNSTQVDYASTPYWGYEADEQLRQTVNHTTWTISNYFKDDYAYPFAQFILIEGADHRVHRSEADYSWDFLNHFMRQEDGSLEESS